MGAAAVPSSKWAAVTAALLVLLSARLPWGLCRLERAAGSLVAAAGGVNPTMSTGFAYAAAPWGGGMRDGGAPGVPTGVRRAGTSTGVLPLASEVAELAADRPTQAAMAAAPIKLSGRCGLRRRRLAPSPLRGVSDSPAPPAAAASVPDSEIAKGCRPAPLTASEPRAGEPRDAGEYMSAPAPGGLLRNVLPPRSRLRALRESVLPAGLVGVAGTPLPPASVLSIGQAMTELPAQLQKCTAKQSNTLAFAVVVVHFVGAAVSSRQPPSRAAALWSTALLSAKLKAIAESVCCWTCLGQNIVGGL